MCPSASSHAPSYPLDAPKTAVHSHLARPTAPFTAEQMWHVMANKERNRRPPRPPGEARWTTLKHANAFVSALARSSQRPANTSNANSSPTCIAAALSQSVQQPSASANTADAAACAPSGAPTQRTTRSLWRSSSRNALMRAPATSPDSFSPSSSWKRSASLPDNARKLSSGEI